jgi:hypothetical protein
MWLFMSDSFLSIVDERAKKAPRHRRRVPRGNDRLVVRARKPGDIQRAFPGAVVTHTPGNDYAYRAMVQRHVVASAIAKAVSNIDYGNFKDSVRDDERHDAYMDVWTAMYRWQNRPSRDRRPVLTLTQSSHSHDRIDLSDGVDDDTPDDDARDPFYIGPCP